MFCWHKALVSRQAKENLGLFPQPWAQASNPGEVSKCWEQDLTNVWRRHLTHKSFCWRCSVFPDAVNEVRCSIREFWLGLWSNLNSLWSHQRKAVSSSREAAAGLAHSLWITMPYTSWHEGQHCRQIPRIYASVDPAALEPHTHSLGPQELLLQEPWLLAICCTSD